MKQKCTPTLTDDYVNRILTYLQGWVVLSDEKIEKEFIPHEYATSFLEVDDVEDDVRQTNTIRREELELYFEKAQTQVTSYIWWDYVPPIIPVHEALLQWTAGLIWKKYNVKSTELSDGSSSYGYGDQLIQMAKRTLKNYIRTRVRSLI